MSPNIPRIYALLGLAVGYLIITFASPVRLAFRDGFRCIMRFKRIWVTFALLAFAYAVFQFATFTPLQNEHDLDVMQFASWRDWQWPNLNEILQPSLLPTAEGVAGIFDNAATTFPLSVLAAVLLVVNWRGLHGSLVRALRRRYRIWGWFIYAGVLISAFASLLKPVVYWRLPQWSGALPAARLLQLSATVDAVAFFFEYLAGVYIQVYLITVCLAWIKGLSFEEEPLFRFAMRRFSYVLKWSSVVMLVSTSILRAPLLLAYFRDIPDVLDYVPLERTVMVVLILAFSSVQISLVLHNEKLREAISAHFQFLRRNPGRFGWFVIVCAANFLFLTLTDALMRGAIAERALGLLTWKLIYAICRGFVTGWMLASWVCLFRQCETARADRESWIRY
jgi:hypothetical protein